MIGPFEPNTIVHGHALELARRLPDGSVNAIITSPPYYGLRSYGIPPVLWPAVTFAPMAGLPEMTIPEQTCNLGLEADLWAYVGHLVALFREVRRALREDGTLWLNLGDSYCGYKGENYLTVKDTSNLQSKSQVPAGHNIGTPHTVGLKPKDLMLIPHRVALALQADGWWLRSDCPWVKRNGMPGSQQDRPTVAKEYWFLLSKSERYFFDMEAVRLPAKPESEERYKYAYGGTKAKNLTDTKQRNDGYNEYRNPSGRARRDSDWFFDSLRAILEDNAQILLTSEEGDPLALTVNPTGYKAAHFAVFPPALVTPLVLASTSERGHCPKCGNGWVRVVEKVKGEPDSYNGSSFHKGKTKEAREQLATVGEQERTAAAVTTGWQPTCAHNLEPIPALILDPFSGSGTVAREAARNRRRYLGFELNEAYLQLAEGRATVQIEMF